MKVKVLKSFVYKGCFMEQTLTVDIDAETAQKLHNDLTKC